MLTFITTLAHPRNTASLETTGRLLSSTLRSACNQTIDRFRVVVVGNEIPPVDLDDPHVRYVTVGFPPAAQDAGPAEFADRMLDKGVKLAVGVSVARAEDPDHVMILDYDDLVHHGIAAFTSSQPTSAGWYLPDGYLHTMGTRHVHPMRGDFHERCGSSAIIRTALVPVPDLDPTATKDEVIEAVGEHILVDVLARHRRRHEYFELDPLPFPAAVWRVGTGANVSGTIASSPSARVPLTDELCAAFAIERPSALAALTRSVGLARQRVRRRLRG